jgi:hypothetical protein
MGAPALYEVWKCALVHMWLALAPGIEHLRYDYNNYNYNPV